MTRKAKAQSRARACRKAIAAADRNYVWIKTGPGVRSRRREGLYQQGWMHQDGVMVRIKAYGHDRQPVPAVSV